MSPGCPAPDRALMKTIHGPIRKIGYRGGGPHFPFRHLYFCRPPYLPCRHSLISSAPPALHTFAAFRAAFLRLPLLATLALHRRALDYAFGLRNFGKLHGRHFARQVQQRISSTIDRRNRVHTTNEAAYAADRGAPIRFGAVSSQRRRYLAIRRSVISFFMSEDQA